MEGTDCTSTVCDASACTVPRCDDVIANGEETDVDCGGPCIACADGLLCGVASDCTSGVCDVRCAAPTCSDGVQNGGEVGLDCRGPCPALCGDGSPCADPADCTSGVCTTGMCGVPACDDGVTNGGETDADCGGTTSCPRCPDGRVCTGPADCATAMCTSGRCGSGALYVGFANWSQSASSMNDAAQDAAMNSACASAYAGSRAATIDEIIGGLIIGIPATNTSGQYLLGRCPNCAGSAHTGCIEGHARNCVRPSEAWPTSLPWTSEPNCHSSSRSAACVR